MFTRNKGYVNLKGGWRTRSPWNGLHFTPQTPIVQLSGRKRTWLYRKPAGVILQGSGGERQAPRIDFNRIVYAFLSGVSLVLVFLGIFNLRGKNKGEPLGSS